MRIATRHLLWILPLVTLVLLVAFLDVLVDGPLRTWMVRAANQRLEGYTIELGRADLRPWALAITLQDLMVIQEANPDPPVAVIPALDADLHWRALLSGRVVAEARFDSPALHVDLRQFRAERNDDVPLEDRGWQRLVEVYRVRVNNLEISDGSLTYIDEDPERPIRVTRIQLTARNIRHVTGASGSYPSPVRAEAVVFGQGRLEAAGHADFLREPWPGFRGGFTAAAIPLQALGPVIEDYHVHMSGGVVSGQGQLEISPEITRVHVARVLVDGIHVDYVSTPDPEVAEAGRQVVEAADEAQENPGMQLLLDELVVRGDLGFVNGTAEPRYRLFLQDAEISLRNLSNQSRQGLARLSVAGLFMGSGQTRMRGAFRPGPGQADFALDTRITGTRMQAMNDLLRAHANLDVTAGTFSLFSQIRVQEGTIRGYVKPLFRDMNVYDPEQDEDQNLFQKLFELVAEGISNVLENPQREEVATVADLSGPLEDPDSSAIQIIGNLLRNAFIEAILPGFRREAGVEEDG